MKRVLALLLFFSLASLAFATQSHNYTCTHTVVKTFGDEAGHLARLGSTLFTYDADDNFYYSPDAGANWIKRGEKSMEYLWSYPDTRDATTYGRLYAVHNYLSANSVYSHRANVYRSTDNGESWTPVSDPVLASERDLNFRMWNEWRVFGWSPTHAKYYLLDANSGAWQVAKDFKQNFLAGWIVTLPEMLFANGNTYAVVNGKNEVGQQTTRIYILNTTRGPNFFSWQATIGGNAMGNAIISYNGWLYLLVKSGNAGSIYRTTLFSNANNWTRVLYASNKMPVQIRANNTHGIYALFSNGDVYHGWNGVEWKLIHNVNQTAIKDFILPTGKHYSFLTAGNKVVRLGCNTWPIAAIAQPSTFYRTVGTRVILNASTSMDYDKDVLNFQWVQNAGPSVTLSGVNTAALQFTPTQAGIYNFTVRVRDSGVPAMPVSSANIKKIKVVVSDPGAATPTPEPVVEEAVPTPIPEEAPEPTPGPLPEAATGPTPSFPAEPTPPLTEEPTPQTTLEPTLTPNASPEETAQPTPESITPTAAPEGTTAPTATAMATPTSTPSSAEPPTVAAVVARISARQGEIVLMQATGSDPAGRPLSYSWRQVSGRLVQLEQASSERPSFVPPAAGVYEFEVVAASGDGRRSRPATVTVTVEEAPRQAEQTNALLRVLEELLNLLRRIFGG